MSGSFKLNRKFFNNHKMRSTTIQQASYDTRVSRPTLMKYLQDDPGELSRIDCKVLFAILVDGMGMNPSDIEKMTIGELFSVEEDAAQ